jgi:ELWxxDGT repeat protein
MTYKDRLRATVAVRAACAEVLESRRLLADVSFTTPLAHPAPSSFENVLHPIAVGDFDGNGTPDVVAGTSQNRRSTWWGQGDGTFSTPTVYAQQMGIFETAVADFNGDGRDDIASTGNPSSGNRTWVHLSNGDGTFTQQLASTLNGSIAVGDFTGDGRLDLALASTKLRIFAGDGAGNFGQPVEHSVPGPSTNWLRAGDFSGDGRLDLLCSNGVMLQQASGTFTIVSGSSPGVTPPAVGDINGDGHLDWIGPPSSDQTYDLQVRLGASDGTFTALTRFPLPKLGQHYGDYTPTTYALSDLDADGRLDLQILIDGAEGPEGYLAALSGNGDGTFSTPATTVNLGRFRYNLNLVDLNSDGRADPLMRWQEKGTYSWEYYSAGLQSMLTRSLAVTLAPLTATQYAPLTNHLIATFTDPGRPEGIAADYNATITWGDGDQSAGMIVKVGSGYEIRGSHTYETRGSHTLHVQLQDNGGTTAVATGALDVAAFVPTPNADVRLVADINNTGVGTAISERVYAGGNLYFIAPSQQQSSAQAVWRSDGTRAGTVELFAAFASEATAPRGLTVLNDRVYFVAGHTSNPRQIYRAAATGTGAEPITQFTFQGGQFGSLLTAGGQLYFVYDNGQVGAELWRTDGTWSGTQLVKDIHPGQGSSSITSLTRAGSSVYFTADDGTRGVELWRSDGTAAGTGLVGDLALGADDSAISQLTAVGEDLYFRLDTTSHGGELWLADAAGAQKVKELRSGPAGGDPIYLTPVGNRLMFQATGPSGFGLYITDGSADGTRLVHLLPGNASGAGMTAVGGNVYFSYSTTGVGSELWVSDGTPLGTRMLVDLNPGAASASPAQLLNVAGTLYFTAVTATGRDLWRTDGTAAGTRLVADLPDDAGVAPSDFVAAGSSLYFMASAPAAGNELWHSNGTAEGTRLIDLTPNVGSSYPEKLVNLGGTIIFQTRQGAGLWRSDGTAAGTSQFHPTLRFAGGGSFGLNTRVVYNGYLYFASSDGGLWRTDGTTADTTLIRQFSVPPQALVVSGGKLFFVAPQAGAGQELWVSDGTAAGTQFLKDICPGTTSADIYHLADVDGTLFFFARETSTGPTMLYTSDGTAAGTVRVSDQVFGRSNTGDYAYITNFGGKALFGGYSAAGRELWISDGTAAGTIRLTDIRAGSIDSISLTARPVVVGSKAYFTGEDGGLYCTDGTPQGLTQIGLYNNIPQGLTAFKGEVYFSVYAGHYELWAVDPASDQPRLVKRLINTARQGHHGLSSLQVVGDRAYFRADVTDIGNELWVTDGTTAGTVLASDIWPGLGDSYPAEFVLANGTLFFAAADARGTELWAVPAVTPPATAPNGLIAALAGHDLRLTWQHAGADHNGLRLERSGDAGFKKIHFQVSLPATARSYLDTTALPGSTYYYRLVAFNPAGDSAGAQTTATLPAVPRQPAQFEAQALSQTSLEVTWQSVSLDETHFVLERSTTGDFAAIDFSTTLPASTTRFTDIDLIANATYYYRLRGVNDLGASRDVATSGRTLDVVPLPPSGLNVTVLSASTIRLTWTDNANNELGYRIDRSTTADFSSIDARVTLGINAASWEDSGLIEGVRYYYRVRAFGGGGESAAQYVDVATQQTLPLAPSTLNADALTARSIGLTWIDHAINEAGYRIERREGNGAFETIGTIEPDRTSFTDTTLYGGIAYTYRVVAFNTVGERSSNTATTAAPGQAQLVADLNTVSSSTKPQEITSIGGSVFFFGDTTHDGRGLFRSDGTSAGTAVLRAGWSYMPSGLTAVGNRVFFFARHTAYDPQLWISDGTADGTQQVPVQLTQGMSPVASVPLGSAGGLFFFRLGNALWRSDGTAEGTFALRNGFDWRDGYTQYVLPVGNELWFVAKPGMAEQTAIFRTDGTAAGTVIVTQAPQIRELQQLGSHVYFTREDGLYNPVLYRTDGTAAGTLALTSPTGPYRAPRWLKSYAGSLAFVATVDDQPRMVRYNPAADTFAVTVLPWLQHANVGAHSGWVEAFGRLFYAANSLQSSMELWSTDGTGEGTTHVATFNELTDPYSGVRNLTFIGDELLFTVAGANGDVLWRTNGTPTGTHPLWPSGVSGVRVVADGQRAFFSAQTPTAGTELWVSDGTAAGTRLAGDPTAASVGSSSPAALTPAGDRLFFVADDGQRGSELWSIDRATGLASLARDIAPGAASGLSSAFAQGARAVHNGILYFAASDGISGEELWRSDGTEAGTWQVADIVAGSGGSAPRNLVSFGGELYFSAAGQTYRLSTGTPQVVPFAATMPAGTQQRSLTAAGGKLYLVTLDSGSTSADLWVLAGDASQWQRLRTYQDDPSDFYSFVPPQGLVDVAGTLYFSAPGDTAFHQLWKSDGTATGTVRAAPSQRVVGNLVPMGGSDKRLFFSAWDASNRYQLWSFDTAAGTVRQLTSFGSTNTWDASLGWQVIGGKLYFTASNGSTGTELWRSDGTVAGTQLVRDIYRSGASWPTSITGLDGIAYFSAYDPYGGYQVWRSDGSSAGTFRVSDIAPGTPAPDGLVAWNGRIYFAASGTETGRELWSVVAPPVTPPAPTAPKVVSTGVNLTWAPSSGSVSEYLVERRPLSTVAVSSDSDASGYSLIGKVPGELKEFIDGTVIAGQRYAYRIRAANGGGVSAASDELQTTVPTPPASVAARHLFYNRSYFDKNNASANADDDLAIAPDKHPLLPGQKATFANYSSYSRGINGLIIDIQDLADPAGLTLANLSAYFAFKIGNTTDPATWATAPAPISVTLRPGAGAGGSDRITLIWADNAIQKQWLQVTIKAGPATGLVTDDVFYYGNAPGESGNSTTNTWVNSTDELRARNNPRTPSNRAPIDYDYDYTRDGLVNSADQLLARNNPTTPSTSLLLLQAPQVQTAPAMSTAEPVATQMASLSTTSSTATLATGATADVGAALPATQPTPGTIARVFNTRLPVVPAAASAAQRPLSAPRSVPPVSSAAAHRAALPSGEGHSRGIGWSSVADLMPRLWFTEKTDEKAPPRLLQLLSADGAARSGARSEA